MKHLFYISFIIILSFQCVTNRQIDRNDLSPGKPGNEETLYGNKDGEEVDKIRIVEICSEELPNQGQLEYVRMKSQNTSSLKIAKSLFSYIDGKLEMRDSFSKLDLDIIERYYESVIKDVKSYWLSAQIDDKEFVNIVIAKSLNQSTSCRTKSLRVTPFFLQSLYLESLNYAIRINTELYKGNNKIKKFEDYFDIIYNLQNSIDGGEEVALEYQRITLLIGFEFMKVFLFTFGHEFCHFLTDCELGQQYEYDADLLGIFTYQTLWGSFSSFDLSTIYNCYFGTDNIHYVHQADSIKVIELIMGRNLVPIVESIYKHTDFEKESITHPPLSRRLERIDEYISDTHQDSMLQILVSKEILKF